MMKSILVILFGLMFSLSVAADFMHPMDFKGSDEEKARVIQIIKEDVRKTYCNSVLDMCQDTTLRMMEQENLNAFKNATRAENREIMDRVIKTYCNPMLSMCSYTNIMMMYEENVKASKQDLAW